MDREEIITGLLKLIKHHFESGASVHQEPYKGDFFKLFKEAYHNRYFENGHPILTGDSLVDVIAARWHTGDENEDQPKREFAWKVLRIWDQWRYAWDHYD